MFLMMESWSYLQKDRKVNHEMSGDVRFYLFGDDYKSVVYYLRGGTRKVGKQERNRRKNEGERAGKKT